MIITIDFHELKDNVDLALPDFLASYQDPIEAIWVYRQVRDVCEGLGISEDDPRVKQVFDRFYDNHESWDQYITHDVEDFVEEELNNG